MKIIDVYDNIKYLKILNKIDGEIKNVSTDTRKIKEQDLYFGIKGENFDGNVFYKEAFSKGATVAVLDKVEITLELEEYLKENNKSIIVVEDTIKALGDLARFKRKLFQKPVVAITGSSGKTSTKDIIYSVLNEKYNAHKTIGNQNNHIGLPLTILSLDEKTEVLVLEMGMDHLGEISYLTNIAKPDVAIITNVGTSHIGNLGSRENILKAKLEILEGLNKNGTLIINNDNDLLHDWYQKHNAEYNVITIGFKTDAQYKATSIKMHDNESEFTCHNLKVHVPVGGEHFIYNSLVALAVGDLFEVSKESILKGIGNFELTQNRMDTIYDKENDITVIDDSYNSNPDSLKYGLKYLSSLPGRRIAVMGTMLCLGEFSESLHASIGDIIHEEGIDYIITVGEYTEFINKRAIELGLPKDHAFHYDDKKDAIKKINEMKQKGDKILVKASMLLQFKEIVQNII